MADEENAALESRSHRVPVLTVALVIAAVALLVILTLDVLPNPYVWGYTRLTGVLLLVPPVLGLIGAVAAFFDRKLSLTERVTWAVGSAVGGFVIVWAGFVLTTLLYGP